MNQEFVDFLIEKGYTVDYLSNNLNYHFYDVCWPYTDGLDPLVIGMIHSSVSVDLDNSNFHMTGTNVWVKDDIYPVYIDLINSEVAGLNMNLLKFFAKKNE